MRVPPPSSTIALTHGAPNAFTSVPSKTADRSINSMPNRVSGLSVPYRSMASAQVIRGTGSGRSSVTASAASRTASDTNPRMSSWVTKEASTSNWENSNCRSARRSSSRRHRAIW